MNSNFTVYSTTGAILRTGFCRTDAVDLQVREGEFVVASSSDPNTQYVDLTTGKIKNYTDSELAAKNDLPDGFIWKMPERVAVDMRSLEEAKVLKWAEIKKARAQLEFAPFECDGNVYDGDQRSRERIASAVTLAMLAKTTGQSYLETWTLENNTTVQLTADQMIAVGTALGSRISAVFDAARALRERIDASQSVSEIDSLKWGNA